MKKRNRSAFEERARQLITAMTQKPDSFTLEETLEDEVLWLSNRLQSAGEEQLSKELRRALENWKTLRSTEREAERRSCVASYIAVYEQLRDSRKSEGVNAALRSLGELCGDDNSQAVSIVQRRLSALSSFTSGSRGNQFLAVVVERLRAGADLVTELERSELLAFLDGGELNASEVCSLVYELSTEGLLGPMAGYEALVRGREWLMRAALWDDAITVSMKCVDVSRRIDEEELVSALGCHYWLLRKVGRSQEAHNTAREIKRLGRRPSS